MRAQRMNVSGFRTRGLCKPLVRNVQVPIVECVFEIGKKQLEQHVLQAIAFEGFHLFMRSLSLSLGELLKPRSA